MGPILWVLEFWQKYVVEGVKIGIHFESFVIPKPFN